MKNKLQDQINHDALLREVVEDVQNERLQQLWSKYGLFIILGVALILTATISFESFRNWQTKKHQELSNTYSIALSLQGQGRFDESLDIYKTLAEKSSAMYSDLSKMQIANIYMEQGRENDAVDVLQHMVESAKTQPQLKVVAALKLASYKLDHKAPAQEIKDLLLPLIENGDEVDAAHELLAMLNIREKDMASAKEEYAKIASSDTASDELKARAHDMINILDN